VGIIAVSVAVSVTTVVEVGVLNAGGRVVGNVFYWGWNKGR
jgi:hypothetical protein